MTQPFSEKTSHIMLYTRQSLVWGKVRTKPAIRINTWLRTDMAPTYMKLFDAQMLPLTGAQKPLKFPQMFFHTDQIIAYHILPPTEEPLDYDPNEPNRKLVPVTAMVGNFRFDGSLRMAQQTKIESFLSVSKANYLSFYDATMSCPVLTSIKGVRASLALIRQSEASFISG